jgi:hypothetical protein
MSKLSDTRWWNDFATELNGDEDWTRAARYFDGRIQFKHDSGYSTLAVLAGKSLLFPGWQPPGRRHRRRGTGRRMAARCRRQDRLV